MLTRTRKLYVVVLALLIATYAHGDAYGDGPSYDFVAVGYSQIDIDGFNDNPSGFGLQGSFSLSEDFFASLQFTSAGVTILGTDVDLDQMDLQLGYKREVADNTDFVVRFGWVDVSAETLGISVDDNGFSLGVGWRSILSDGFEGGLEFQYVDLSDTGSDTALAIYGAYQVASTVDILGQLSIADGSNQFTIGARFNF
ncbi:MAG: outer membrane beta-barrel protein [Pseudomonadota bacterium]